MHSPKFLCCACLGTKWGSVGSDCVSNLDINRQGWESTLLPCSCQFASGSLVRIPTYPVTTGAARARDRHGRENLKHFCVWDSKPLTLRGLLVSSTFSCLKLPKKSILRNWKYTITQKKKKSLFFFLPGLLSSTPNICHCRGIFVYLDFMRLLPPYKVDRLILLTDPHCFFGPPCVGL